MRKISISMTKGGVGKTITAVNLSSGLAMNGAKVLLVDTDTQGQVSPMLGIATTYSLADLMFEQAKPDDIVVKARENLWIIAGGRALAAVKRSISRKDIGAEASLKEALQPLERNFDYVILDTSPGWDALTVNVLFYVDEIVAPVSLEILTIQAFAEFTKSVAAIQKYNEKLSIKYILPTFLDGRVKKSSEILQQLTSHYKKQICDPIRYNVKLSEAPGYGQTIYEYAPGSNGEIDYNKFTRRVMYGS